MKKTIGLKVTAQMKADFEACMAILAPNDPEPFKADLRGVVEDYGQEFAARWIAGWRQELETHGIGGDHHIEKMIAEAA